MFPFSLDNECSVHLGQSVTSHLHIFPSTGDFTATPDHNETRHTLFGGAQDKDRAFEEKTSLLRIQNTVILSEVDFTIAQRANGSAF